METNIVHLSIAICLFYFICSLDLKLSPCIGDYILWEPNLDLWNKVYCKEKMLVEYFAWMSGLGQVTRRNVVSDPLGYGIGILKDHEVDDWKNFRLRTRKSTNENGNLFYILISQHPHNPNSATCSEWEFFSSSISHQYIHAAGVGPSVLMRNWNHWLFPEPNKCSLSCVHSWRTLLLATYGFLAFSSKYPAKKFMCPSISGMSTCVPHFFSITAVKIGFLHIPSKNHAYFDITSINFCIFHIAPKHLQATKIQPKWMKYPKKWPKSSEEEDI